MLDPVQWIELAENEKGGKFCLALFILGQHLRDRGFLYATQTEKLLFRSVCIKGMKYISKLSSLPLPVKDAIEKAGVTQKLLRLCPNRFESDVCLQRYLSSPYFVKGLGVFSIGFSIIGFKAIRYSEGLMEMILKSYFLPISNVSFIFFSVPNSEI